MRRIRLTHFIHSRQMPVTTHLTWQTRNQWLYLMSFFAGYLLFVNRNELFQHKKIPQELLIGNHHHQRHFSNVFYLLHSLALIFFGSDESTSFTHRHPAFDLTAIGGYQDVMSQLTDIVRYLQNPPAFNDKKIQPPKGIILSGPPGVGKTALVEAVAGQAGVPLFMISAPEFESKYVGESERAIRSLFDNAKKHAPCIVCIDEFDSIACKRDYAESNPRTHHHNSQVNQLLSTLSQNHPGVVVFATTNHYESLDSAIVRPGRFDRHIALSLPNTIDREKILRVFTNEKPLHQNVSLKNLAKITEGFSGAKLNSLVNEAALAADRAGSSQISMQHFDSARTVLAIGKQRTPILDPALSKQIATHEIGHALVGVTLGLTLYKVVISDSGPQKGYTEWLPKEHQRYLKSELLDNICMLLGSRAAEELSDQVSLGCADDIRKAKEIAMMMCDEGMLSTISGISMSSEIEIEKILQEQKHRAKKILESRNKERIKLVEALAQQGELLSDDFNQVISGIAIEKQKEVSARSRFNLFGRFSSETASTAMPSSQLSRLKKQEKTR